MIASYTYKGVKHRVLLEGSYRTDGTYELEVKLPRKDHVIKAVASDSNEAIRQVTRHLEKMFGRIE